MKKLFLLTFIFHSNLLLANEACRGTDEKSLKTCLEEVSKAVANLGASPQAECREMLSATTVRTQSNIDKSYPLHPLFRSKGADCSKFLAHDGSDGYGPWGREVIGYLNESSASSSFFDDNLAGMSNGVLACPKWKTLNRAEKKHFWVWVMTSIAHVEATCKEGERNGNATNGVAVGLFQLDERRSARRWRGPNCGVERVTHAKENIRCAMDILGDLLKGKSGTYKGSGEIWGRPTNSYWQHLRQRNGGDIAKLIQSHPLCK